MMTSICCPFMFRNDLIQRSLMDQKMNRYLWYFWVYIKAPAGTGMEERINGTEAKQNF